MTTPREVRDFWMPRDPASPEELMAAAKRLGPGLDGELRDRFASTVEEAFAGGLSEWESTPEGLQALIVVLDQFPRHIFRGTARQYEGDARALALALSVRDAEWVQQLPPFWRTFMMFPMAHSEDVEIHRRLVALADDIATKSPDWYGVFKTIGPSQSRKYLTVMEQFGRFPHRNGMLGRENTPEEQVWLAAGNAERMGPDALRGD